MACQLNILAESQIKHPTFAKTMLNQNDTVTMNVKPGSKTQNLVPFAVKAFQSADCRKILWQSLHGATAKTVTCAEQFKQACMPKTEGGEEKHGRNSSQYVQFQELFQSSRIYLQKRDVTLEDAGLCYTVEEAAIAILLSKDPIPEDISAQRVNKDCSFEAYINSSASMDEKPVSRKRLKHTKKRKREVTQSAPEKAKLVKDGKSNRIRTESAETSVPGALSFLCSRLAPGLEAVKKVCNDPSTFNTDVNPR